jgi:hypothetical protein
MSQSQEETEYEMLDLDINKYTIADLERFFRLNYASAPYTADDVQYKEYVIREELLRNVQTNKKIKSELVSFLENAKRLIIAAKCPFPTPPTSIPHNYRLDPTPDYPLPPLSISRNEELVVPTYIKPLHTTNGNQYYNGSLNPIESRLKTINLCIDTLFRKNYTSTKSTDFTYILPKVINNVVSLKLASFEFPVVWNTFSAADKNNVMYVSLYNMTLNGAAIPDVVDFEIVIPDGNYTQNTFVQTVNNIFNKNANIGLAFLWCEVDSTSLSTIFRARNYVTEEAIGGSFPFRVGSPQYSPNFYFTIDFALKNDMYLRPNYKNLGWMLGFRDAFYTVRPTDIVTSYTALLITHVVFAGYLKSESIFGSNINNYFFVEVDDFQNNFPTDSIIAANDPYGNYLGKNIIARLIIGSDVNSIVNDNGADLIFKRRDYFGPVNLEKLKIRVLNRFGDVINTNQNDCSMTFEITTLNMNG